MGALKIRFFDHPALALCLQLFIFVFEFKGHQIFLLNIQTNPSSGFNYETLVFSF
jgi:hypothetical protein